MNDYSFLLPELAPSVPADPSRFPIGIVGAGSITRYGHMPAYKKAGFNVRAIASRTAAHARNYKNEYNIPLMFDDPLDLARSDEIAVLDMTFPYDEDRLPVIKSAAEHGKAILIQKPLAHSLETANEIIAIGKANGVNIAVNQNARWSPHYRMAHLLKREGFFGELYFLEHRMMNNQAGQSWFAGPDKWYSTSDRFQVLEYGIHHIDLLRFWAGCEPAVVGSRRVTRSDLPVRGDIAYGMTLDFGGAIGSLVEDNSAALSTTPTSTFRVAGTRGEVTGESMGPSPHITLYAGSESQRFELKEHNWFPDGFIGTMGELLLSVEERRESTISAGDNVHSLRIALSAYTT